MQPIACLLFEFILFFHLFARFQSVVIIQTREINAVDFRLGHVYR